MKRRLLAALSIAAVAAFASLSGCDWYEYAFMNSIPFKAGSKAPKETSVYLGIDGLAYHTILDAMKKGAFSGPEWQLGKFITMFPGTSDASWTRILHTEKIGGYEMEYYNPTIDAVENKGLLGVARHLMPTLTESLSFEAQYLSSFDYRANGYSHALEAYSDTYYSMGETFDNLFYSLEGRSQTDAVFSAYLLEFDVMGHMHDPMDCTEALLTLSKRIDSFKAAHPDQKFHFTLFSDHGMDFIPVQKENLIEFDQEMTKVGITPVTTMLEHDPTKELYAVPIIHTRVTYVALHTHEALREEVAGRTSSIPSVDMAISKIKSQDKNSGSENDWYGIWTEGKLTVAFGFNPKTNLYTLPRDQDYARIAQKILFAEGELTKTMSDEELFALSKNSTYPDVFFRARTSLADIGAIYPADVMISFRPGFVSVGFRVPGKEDIATASFHGAMDTLGSTGILLSTERDIPDAVRSDTLLDLFPKLKEHNQSLGTTFVPGDANALLDYSKTK
ncbi:alkaline phosphatase family protein [Bdellovibrionota bacterium FG-2]